MRALSKLPFLPRFSKQTTTIYPKIYIGDDNKITADTLLHEYVHLADWKKIGLLFPILYLMPQIFALLAVAAIGGNLWWLLCLLFLLPIPSPTRAYLEWRAYRAEMIFEYVRTGQFGDIEHRIEQFISANYYFMFPFKKYIKSKFTEAANCARVELTGCLSEALAEAISSLNP